MRNIISIILVIAAIGAGWLYIWPAWQEVRILNATVDQYDQALLKVQEFRSLRDQHIEDYISFSGQDINRINEMLPSSFDSLWMFMNLDAVSAEYGIDITDLEVEEVDTEDDEEEIGSSEFIPHIVSFSFTANYSTMISFLQDLESRLHLLDVSEIGFDSSGDDSSEYNYDVVLYTYSISGS